MKAHGKGAALAAAGSVLWGASGIAGQVLLQDKGVTPEWLSAARMIGAGVLLLAFTAQRGERLFPIWREKALALLLFGVLGMIGVQYTYFAAIALSNAATATILQYTMPILVILWTALTERRMPGVRVLAALVLAVGGVALLVTRGEWGTLAIFEEALFWGLLSAAGAAFYTVQPKAMIRRYPSSLVVGWGMLIGGVTLAPTAGLFSPPGLWDGAALASLAFVIVFGTALAFWLYISSVEYIEPPEASLFGAAAFLRVSGSVLFPRLPLRRARGGCGRIPRPDGTRGDSWPCGSWRARNDRPARGCRYRHRGRPAGSRRT